MELTYGGFDLRGATEIPIVQSNLSLYKPGSPSQSVNMLSRCGAKSDGSLDCGNCWGNYADVWLNGKKIWSGMQGLSFVAPPGTPCASNGPWSAVQPSSDFVSGRSRMTYRELVIDECRRAYDAQWVASHPGAKTFDELGYKLLLTDGRGEFGAQDNIYLADSAGTINQRNCLDLDEHNCLMHELGHVFGLQHKSDTGVYAGVTDAYSDTFDIMGGSRAARNREARFVPSATWGERLELEQAGPNGSGAQCTLAEDLGVHT